MKILVYPKDPNPYQELLYRKLKSKVTVKYLEPPVNYYIFGTFIFPIQLLYYRMLGYRIFHLHWTYNFKFPIDNLFLRAIATAYFITLLIIIKLLGYKLIWTVHNITPHEKQFIDDVWVRIFLSKLCHAKIVHSKSTINEMKNLGLDTKNSYVIPIGNYIDVYENKVSRNYARKHFKFNEKDTVFLFFGRIDQYKGLIDLLDVFEKLIRQNKHIKLLIGGKCSNEGLQKTLNNYKNKLKINIRIYKNYIKDEDAQYFFNSADVAVYPFKEVTTSSSVILASSFSKPVICPRLGALRDMPTKVGYFYDAKDKDGLFRCMLKAIKNKDELELMGKNGFNYAKLFSWEKISNQTYDVYKKVISG